MMGFNTMVKSRKNKQRSIDKGHQMDLDDQPIDCRDDDDGSNRFLRHDVATPEAKDLTLPSRSNFMLWSGYKFYLWTLVRGIILLAGLAVLFKLQLPSEPASYSYDDYITMFHETARSMEVATDKVTTHTYQIMYGRHLLPYYQQNPEMKMLEIGLGCDMKYGPGRSISLWKKLFPKAELWEAEYDGECVDNLKEKGQLDGFQTLTGDQGDDKVLDNWIEISGGKFDVVIDDGGHQNCQIWHSFMKLWPTVKPGGLYFIEDMQVAKMRVYRNFTTEKCDSNLIVPEKLKIFIDELLYDVSRKSDLEFIFCQSEACVLGKKKDDGGKVHMNLLRSSVIFKNTTESA